MTFWGSASHAAKDDQFAQGKKKVAYAPQQSCIRYVTHTHIERAQKGRQADRQTERESPGTKGRKKTVVLFPLLQ